MKQSEILRQKLDALWARVGKGEEAAGVTVRLAVLVAHADGVIDEEESASLYESLGVLLGAKVEVRWLKHFVREALEELQTQGNTQTARAVGQWFQAREGVSEALSFGLAVAYASEGLSAAEKGALELVAKATDADAGTLEGLILSFEEQLRQSVP